MKEFRFISKQSLKEFKVLPDHVQKRFALDLNAVCQGKESFSKFKHISDSVGVGAVELIENGRPVLSGSLCGKTQKRLVYPSFIHQDH